MRLSKLLTIGLIFALTACTSAEDSGTRIAANDNEERQITHTYQGKTYPLSLRWDGLLRGYIVNSKITPSTNWKMTDADDVLFQNMVRSAFREQVCTDGLHPGVLQFGYGFSEGNGWYARVKCTAKFQDDAT